MRPLHWQLALLTTTLFCIALSVKVWLWLQANTYSATAVAVLSVVILLPVVLHLLALVKRAQSKYLIYALLMLLIYFCVLLANLASNPLQFNLDLALFVLVVLTITSTALLIKKQQKQPH